MILCNGDEIVEIDSHRHKFSDAMSEYLWHLSLVSGEDRSTGNVDCATGWFAQFGKRILVTDWRGRVWIELCENQTRATELYDLLEAEFNTWNDDTDDWEDWK